MKIGEHYDVNAYRRGIERACQLAYPPPAHLARQLLSANGRKHESKRWETTTEWRARLIPLRAYSRLRVGVIGNVVNMAARLMSAATTGEVLTSNAFYQALPANRTGSLTPVENVDAKNVGRIMAWRAKGGR